MGVITALEIQKKNKERVNVYLDGEFAFGLALIEAAKLRKGQTLTEADITVLRQQDTITRAVDTAARFLAYRPRSTQEIRQNLKSKDYSEIVVEEAIHRLMTLGYLDDEAFARFWLENRETFKPRGPMALRHELRQKGVEDAVIDRVLASMDTEDSAYRAAQARLSRLRGSTQQVFQQKISSFLQRRGFNYAVSREVIDQLISEITADDPSYFSEDDDTTL